MLGNIADNACKWARSAVRDGGSHRAGVRPEGHPPPVAPGRRRWPGFTADQRAQGIKRGRRLDESKPGSGLGHSIVADLAQSYRGHFSLEESDLGGLSARLDLPAP